MKALSRIVSDGPLAPYSPPKTPANPASRTPGGTKAMTSLVSALINVAFPSSRSSNDGFEFPYAG